MNEQFFEAFSDMLPEGYGEDPSRVIQPVGQAPPSSGRVREEAYSGNSGNSAESVDNPGPTQTPLEAPTAHRYQDNPKDAAVIERQLFLQNYAGLAGLALDNTSDSGSRTLGPGTGGYTYIQYADGHVTVVSGPKGKINKDYAAGSDGAKAVEAEFGKYPTSSSSSSSSSTKKKSMSKKGATALGAGIGAGVGELAKSLASMLGPQSAMPLSQEELTGTTTTETSSSVPWGWILGGAGVLLVGGVVIFAVSRGGGSSSEE